MSVSPYKQVPVQIILADMLDGSPETLPQRLQGGTIGYLTMKMLSVATLRVIIIPTGSEGF